MSGPKYLSKRDSNKRPCHECGRLITDYMCKECWEKRQGFSPRDINTSPLMPAETAGFRRSYSNRYGSE